MQKQQAAKAATKALDEVDAGEQILSLHDVPLEIYDAWGSPGVASDCGTTQDLIHRGNRFPESRSRVLSAGSILRAWILRCMH